MASATEIGRYMRATDLIKEYNIVMDQNSVSFSLRNSSGNFLGNFYSTDELYYYMLGYQSGQMDSFVSKTEQND